MQNSMEFERQTIWRQKWRGIFACQPVYAMAEFDIPIKSAKSFHRTSFWYLSRESNDSKSDTHMEYPYTAYSANSETATVFFPPVDCLGICCYGCVCIWNDKVYGISDVTISVTRIPYRSGYVLMYSPLYVYVFPIAWCWTWKKVKKKTEKKTILVESNVRPNVCSTYCVFSFFYLIHNVHVL